MKARKVTWKVKKIIESQSQGVEKELLRIK